MEITVYHHGTLMPILKRGETISSVKKGKLRDSIRIRSKINKKTGYINMRVVAGDKDAYYAHIIEFGSGSFYNRPAQYKTKNTGKRLAGGPYDIKPKNRKSLFFAGIMREVITHPGVTPKPFMRPAFDATHQAALNATAAYFRKKIPKEIEKATKS